MASSNNVFVESGWVEDGYFELAVIVPVIPAVLNLGAPGAAVHALPFRTLGGSVIDLDLLYGIVGHEAELADIQPIFAVATREGLIRAYGEEIPRQAIQDACIETFATLLEIEDIIIEGNPLGDNLFGSMGLTTRPMSSVTLDNSDGEWNRLVLRELMLYAPAGLFIDIGGTVVAPLMTGTISSIRFEGAQVIITYGFATRARPGFALSNVMNLDQTLPLRTAGEYTNAQNDTDILPEVFGNWLSTDAAAAGSNTIATPCVLIDTVNGVWCANARRTASPAPEVYWNGVLQEPHMYSWNPANNYEGLGVIATLTFTLFAASQGEVTIRHGGAGRWLWRADYQPIHDALYHAHGARRLDAEQL